MEVYIVCNLGPTERQFLSAFTCFDNACVYADKTCGDYDDVRIYKHKLDSKELGEVVYSVDTVRRS